MKSLIRNIFFLILISLGFSSCIHDYYPGDGGSNGELIDPNKTVLLLDLRALNPSTLTTPAEKIKSVRVIITNTPIVDTDTDSDSDSDTDGTEMPATIVECNRLYDFPMLNASNFSYTMSWVSNLGKKSVYVIANEESVSEDLTEELNRYQEMEAAGDLEKWLQEYSFKPNYDTSGNTIYLPYTFFKTDFEPLPAQVNTVNCWLVPVATKFVFYFQNNREYPVKINGISMAYANSTSFMMPNIDKDALYMEYGGQPIYWTDWLAKVSQSSWDYPESGENEWFNQQNGWITAYSVPDPNESNIFTFIKKDSSDVFTVDAAEEKTIYEETELVPGTHTSRIYYLPESINYKNPDNISNPDSDDENSEEERVQTFYLTINFEDMGPVNKAPKFENVPIPNLNALFRNTFVVIKMVMGQGDIEIYAEIAPWNIVTSNGWVSEGNSAPSNNPFAIKRK